MKTELDHKMRALPELWRLSARTVARVSGAAARKEETADGDWELAVRSTFFRQCLRHGVRAEVAREALHDVLDRESEYRLREQAETSSRRAALGWLRLETVLAHYGELAAFALARCLEEAALDIRRRGTPRSSAASPGNPPLPARDSQVVPRQGDPHALSIVQRGRERLALFWESNRFCAA